MNRNGTYEQLRDYLRHFTSFQGDCFVYDSTGVVHLLLAILDNLREHALEAELENIRELFSDEQTEFFLKVADFLREDESSSS